MLPVLASDHHIRGSRRPRRDDLLSVSLGQDRCVELVRLAPHLCLQLSTLGTGDELGALPFLAATDERSGCRVGQDRMQIVSRAFLAWPSEDIDQAEMCQALLTLMVKTERGVSPLTT